MYTLCCNIYPDTVTLCMLHKKVLIYWALTIYFAGNLCQYMVVIYWTPTLYIVPLPKPHISHHNIYICHLRIFKQGAHLGENMKKYVRKTSSKACSAFYQTANFSMPQNCRRHMIIDGYLLCMRKTLETYDNWSVFAPQRRLRLGIVHRQLLFLVFWNIID